jgi:acetylornithine deacetylase/succinyl-diaminopimelate desuccinylase-like protein
VAHIAAQGFQVLTDAEPDHDLRARYDRNARIGRVNWTNAYPTDMTRPESRAVIAALERAWGELPIRARTMGGTVPIDFFIQALGMPALSVPVVNFDNNQHSHNENLRIQNLWDAVVSFAAILQM